MVLLNKEDETAEVYELKPASHLNSAYDASNDEAQLSGYITGLRMNGYRNATRGIAFGAIATMYTFPSTENPGYFIVFRAYPNKPGMIYYDYVKQPGGEKVILPAPKPAEVKEKARESQPNWKLVLQTLGVLAFIAFVIFYILSGGTAPIPDWVSRMAFG